MRVTIDSEQGKVTIHNDQYDNPNFVDIELEHNEDGDITDCIEGISIDDLQSALAAFISSREAQRHEIL